METKLERISQLSRENPDMVFTSLGHLINRELLKNCHEKNERLSIRRNGRRKRPGLLLFASHIQCVYALRTGKMVQGKHRTEIKGIWWSGGLRGRLCGVLPIQRRSGKILRITEKENETRRNEPGGE